MFLAILTTYLHNEKNLSNEEKKNRISFSSLTSKNIRLNRIYSIKGVKRLMNILVITDKLILGGAEMYFCKLENQLQHPNITFYYAAGPGELYEKIKHKEKFSEISRTKHFHNINKLRRLISDRQIDIIHANSLRMVLYCIAVKSFIKKKFRIVYTKHNVTSLEQKNPFIFAHLLNNHVERIITVSEFEKIILSNPELSLAR